MKGLYRNISQHKLGLSVCFLILIYMLISFFELPKLSPMAAMFPRLAFILTTVAALLKVISDLTNSTLLRRIDEISFLRLEMGRALFKKGSFEKGRLKREVLFLVSTFILFGMVYLIGFLPSFFIFSSLFTYLISKKVKLSILIGISVVVMAYLFSLALPGGLWEGILRGGM